MHIRQRKSDYDNHEKKQYQNRNYPKKYLKKQYPKTNYRKPGRILPIRPCRETAHNLHPE